MGGLGAAGDVVEMSEGEQVLEQEIGAKSENPEAQEREELQRDTTRCWCRSPRGHRHSRAPEKLKTTSFIIALRGRGASIASKARGSMMRTCL